MKTDVIDNREIMYFYQPTKRYGEENILLDGTVVVIETSRVKMLIVSNSERWYGKNIGEALSLGAFVKLRKLLFSHVRLSDRMKQLDPHWTDFD
jgi:hypothetical protein